MHDRNPPRLITSRVIAESLNQPLHRVRRVLASRDHIRPAAYAGHMRLYHRDAIAKVRHELTAIDARRAEVQTTDTRASA